MTAHNERGQRAASRDNAEGSAVTRDAVVWQWRDEILYLLIPIAIVAAIVIFEFIMNSAKWGLTR